MTLNDELTVIDQTISELEGRRTEIINNMDAPTGPNIIQFPRQLGMVRVETYRGSGTRRHIW